MQNPYAILDLPKNSPEELLRAKYAELKSKYLEDRFLQGKRGNEAAEKLTELESAFKLIESDFSKKDTTACFKEITAIIKLEQFDLAQEALDNMGSHGAEWHFVQSMLFFRREWITESKKQLEMALNIEPYNPKYLTAMERLNLILGNPAVNPQSLGRAGGIEGLFENDNGAMCGSCIRCCAINACINLFCCLGGRGCE